ncbi:hypothetical protein [Butyrivibrio sp. MC2013]|uniref:hypothetical protein n=1 Tax=Butyrivibrio sp. MC2013 TaxID=1280686 RepID=UPI000410672F|nr:hypothetical protein [Butyrivibrio sp. MC2013]
MKKLVNISLLQLVIAIYSINTVIGKYVGISLSSHGLFSIRTIGLLALEVLALGAYAIFWQQLLPRFQLSVAYANKAVMLLWSLLWSYLLFGESVTRGKAVGVLLVIAGTVILNGDLEENTDTKSAEAKD